MIPPKRKPRSWEPRHRELTPALRAQIIKRIDAKPEILHYKLDRKGYRALEEKLRRSEFFGYPNMAELLEHGIGVVPYAFKPNGFVPVHPTPAWFARKVRGHIKTGTAHARKTWTNNPLLVPLLRFAAKNRNFGYASWEALVAAIENGTFNPKTK